MKCEIFRADAIFRQTILLAGNSNSMMDPRGHPDRHVNPQYYAGHISMSAQCMVRDESIQRRVDGAHRVPPDRLAKRLRPSLPQPAQENGRKPNRYS
jgi:hypothetical protein